MQSEKKIELKHTSTKTKHFQESYKTSVHLFINFYSIANPHSLNKEVEVEDLTFPIPP